MPLNHELVGTPWDAYKLKMDLNPGDTIRGIVIHDLVALIDFQ